MILPETATADIIAMAIRRFLFMAVRILRVTYTFVDKYMNFYDNLQIFTYKSSQILRFSLFVFRLSLFSISRSRPFEISFAGPDFEMAFGDAKIYSGVSHQRESLPGLYEGQTVGIDLLA